MKFQRSQGPVHLFGQGSLQVVEGEILFFGRRITNQSGLVDIFAPRCNALPSFEVLSSDAEVEFTSHVEKSLAGLEATQPNFASLLRPENQNDFQEFVPGLYAWKNTKNQENYQQLLISESWKNVASQLEAHPCPVVFVCGQRKVGKSTFARYLTNALLNRFDTVEFVDLDPGQCEFTTPGFLVRHAVKQPGLFGPPFTHLLMPDDSVFLGSSSTAEIPILYCKGIAEIARRLESAQQQNAARRPVVINMMGWMTGLGFEFLQYAIKTFRPTHLYSFSDPEFDKEGCDVVRKGFTSPSGLMSLQLEGMSPEQASAIEIAYLSVPNADQPKSKFQPADWRNLSYWAYFFGSFNQSLQIEGFKYSCLSYLRPFMVPLRKLQLACTKGDINLFELLGEGRLERLKSMLLLRLVGFSLDDQFKPTRSINLLPRHDVPRVAEMKSFGVGMIRAISPVKRDGRVVDHCLEIITPVPLNILKQTNTLVFGSQMVPNNLFMNDNLSAQVEAPFFSTQNPSDAAGSDARATRSNVLRRNQA